MSLGIPGKKNGRPTGRRKSIALFNLVRIDWIETLWDIGQHRGPCAFRKSHEEINWEMVWTFWPAPTESMTPKPDEEKEEPIMNDDTAMAIIANDLDSLFLRIEALNAAHPKLTSAGRHLQEARDNLLDARQELHTADMRRRHQCG